MRKALANPIAGLVPNPTVLLDEHATRAAILEALVSLSMRTPEHRGQLLVYWSGHMALRREAGVPDIWLPTSDGRGLGLAADIAPIVKNAPDHVLCIIDGCAIGAALAGRLDEIARNLAVLTSCKEDESAMENPELQHGVFTYHLVQALDSPATDTDGDGYLSAEDIFVQIYPSVVAHARRQHPSITGRFAHQIRVCRARRVAEQFVVEVANARREQFEIGTNLWINGSKSEVLAVADRDGKLSLTLSGTSDIVREGLNNLSSSTDDTVWWWYGRSELVKLDDPYPSKESYALLVTCSYKGRPLELDFMTERADELAAALERVGYPRGNIIKLYDEDATTSKVDDALKSFFRGGSREHARRLFFYFGGHGVPAGEGDGALMTHDCDEDRPEMTGLSMQELTGRYLNYIRAHHVFMAIDSCYAGRALMMSPERDFHQMLALSVIQAYTTERARDVLVAAAANQKALHASGGVFTQILTQALAGIADTDKDGVILASDVAAYANRAVPQVVSQFGGRQTVRYSRLGRAEGMSVFFSPALIAGPLR